MKYKSSNYNKNIAYYFTNLIINISNNYILKF